MKKSLIALAALAATASFAQSTVTISGLVDVGYQAVNAGYSSTTATAGALTPSDYKGLKNNGSATTVLTIAGSEDLGGGLKANFQLQLTPDFLTGNGVQNSAVNDTKGDGTGYTAIGNAQQAYAGLSGGFGEVKLGRVNSNALDGWSAGSVFGTALGSGYASNGNIYTAYSTSAPVSAYNTAPTRFNNAIRYESPAFNGFSASVLYVPQNNVVGGTSGGTTGATSDRSTNRVGVTDIGLKYNNGPLNVVYANQKQTAGSEGVVDLVNTNGKLTANTNNKLNILAGNYAIGAATVYAATWTEKSNLATAVSTAGQMVGAKYVIGATTVMASYGRLNDKGTDNADKKIYGLGADYALSKRTNLYVRYENRDANTVSANDDKTTTTAIGVRHTF